MNEEPVVNIGSFPFESLSGLLLTVAVVLVVVVVVVVVAAVSSNMHKMKPMVFLSRLFLTLSIKPELHNVTCVFKISANYIFCTSITVYILVHCRVLNNVHLNCAFILISLCFCYLHSNCTVNTTA